MGRCPDRGQLGDRHQRGPANEMWQVGELPDSGEHESEVCSRRGRGRWRQTCTLTYPPTARMPNGAATTVLTLKAQR
jgi:hypothetical protein